MNSLLCCYFPTKVIFVDDNALFLKNLVPILDHDIASYDFFDDPLKALEFINQGKGINFLPSAFPERKQINEEGYMSIFSPDRYEEVSTVIVDYEMPGMKGLEFCEKLQSPYIRKILNTGVADETLAIEAFNKGLIDGYIRKQDSNRGAIFRDFIIQGQLKYFKDLTDVSMEALIKKDIMYDDHRDSPIYDPSFIKYVTDLIEKNNITEYYFNTNIGGFIFLTAQGKVSALYSLSNEIFDDVQSGYIVTLEQEAANDEQFSPLIEDLDKNRKTICFPFHGNNKNPNIESWESYAYPLDIVQGKNIYYVAYVPAVDYISSSEIFSFEKYPRKK